MGSRDPLTGHNFMNGFLPPITCVFSGMVAHLLSSCARDCAAPGAAYAAPPIQQYPLAPPEPQYGPPPGAPPYGASPRAGPYGTSPGAPPYGPPPTGQYGAPPGAS